MDSLVLWRLRLCENRCLRNNGRKIVEISRLVIKHENRNDKEVLVLLFNYLLIYTHYVKNFNHLAIEVNPRHKDYYKKLLGFIEIGTEKLCPQVENAPAVFLHLPTSHYRSEINRFSENQSCEKKGRELYQYFLKSEQENLVANYLKNQVKPMTIDEKAYFGFTESGISKIVCVH